MNKKLFESRPNERGGATLKFVIFAAIFASVIYAGYLYVPVALDAYYFKDLMQNKADVAITQGYDPSWVKDQLMKLESEYRVPTDAVITSTQADSRVQVRVQYTRPIPVVAGYTYNYEFDHTAKSTAFLSIK
jgi:hypothetical protein